MTQLHQRSHSTRGAKAGAVFGGAGALPNRPYYYPLRVRINIILEFDFF
jgi:hypothetical protein